MSNRTNQTAETSGQQSSQPSHHRQQSSKRHTAVQRSADNSLNNIQSSTTFQSVSFPMTPAKCLKLFGKHLTEYERTEILDFPHVYYFGEGAKKIKAAPAAGEDASKQKQQP